MNAHVIDDIYDMSFLAEWEEILLDDCPVYTTNVANPTSFPHGREGSHRLMGVDIFAREGLNRVTLLHDQAEKFFNAFEILEEEVFKVPIYLRRIDVNLQYQGQDGTSHCDGTNHDEYTVMVMNNTKWKPEWGGQFQMLDEHGTILEEHDYIPGRVVVFPGWIRHRGLAPLVPYVYRFTTVFRVIMEQEKVSLIHEKL